MIIRLSQKLAKKIKEVPKSVLPAHDDPFADWSASLFTFARTQYILFCNTATLYSSVFFGSGNPDSSKLIINASSQLRDHLSHEGRDEIYVNRIAPTLSEVTFSKALNRSVIGSMNELIATATMYLAREELAPCDVGPRLNGVLLSMLGDGSNCSYETPHDCFEKLCQTE